MFDIIDGDLSHLLAARRLDRKNKAPGMPSKPVLIQSLAGKHIHLLVQKKHKYKGEDVLKVHRLCSQPSRTAHRWLLSNHSHMQCLISLSLFPDP